MEELIALRECHLKSVRELFQQLDLFVFTLGLTESWESIEDGRIFPVAPGVIAGEYDKSLYRFKNFCFMEAYSDLESFITLLRTFNKKAKIIQRRIRG